MVQKFLEELEPANGKRDEGSEEYYSPPIPLSSAGAATNQSPDKILDYLDSLEPFMDKNIYQSMRLQELTIWARSTSEELI